MALALKVDLFLKPNLHLLFLGLPVIALDKHKDKYTEPARQAKAHITMTALYPSW